MLARYGANEQRLTAEVETLLLTFLVAILSTITFSITKKANE